MYLIKMYSKPNNYFYRVFCFVFFIGTIAKLYSQYPISLSMLATKDNKYYIAATGELYTGAVINMSKKTWKKILETYLLNGLINGTYKEWYPNGVLKNEGNFINGKRQGRFNSWYPNGKKKNECIYTNDVLDSISLSYYGNGMIKKEHDHDTDLAFIWDYSDSPKILTKFSKQFGKLNGVFYQWDHYGRKIAEGFYKNNKKDSLWRKYDINGKIYEEGKFKNNNKYGVWVTYDDYGRGSVENYYNNGSLDSIKHIVYYMNGEKYVVKSHNIIENKNKIITYSLNGNKISKTIYLSGRLEGSSERWYDNGQKEYEVSFLNNQLDGESQYWRPNGIKMKTGQYSNGEKVGKWTYYDEGGLIIDN